MKHYLLTLGYVVGLLLTIWHASELVYHLPNMYRQYMDLRAIEAETQRIKQATRQFVQEHSPQRSLIELAFEELDYQRGLSPSPPNWDSYSSDVTVNYVSMAGCEHPKLVIEDRGGRGTIAIIEPICDRDINTVLTWHTDGAGWPNAEACPYDEEKKARVCR